METLSTRSIMCRKNGLVPVLGLRAPLDALGTLNVTNYGDYKYKDPETVASYAASGNKSRTVSIETSHGLIRLSRPEASFMR